jgi:hypothetical protein
VKERLFREGGPLRVTRTGPDQYEFRIPVQPGEDGMHGRACPGEVCAPGYFRVETGTGITTPQTTIYCPYCRREEDPAAFGTHEQHQHAIEHVKAEALDGINRTMAEALGLGPSGRRKIGGGLVSVEMSMTPARRRRPGRLIEEELRRDVVCPHCTLHQAVFGLAIWCSDCGSDIFPTHVAAELSVLRKVLEDVGDRRARLGARIAARDIENTLEDLVSVMEAVLKALTKRQLCAQRVPPKEAELVIGNEIRTGYQSLGRARAIFAARTGALLGRGLSEDEFVELSAVLEKRHPIAHNLGVIDRKYLLRACSGELEGREIRIEAEEVGQTIDRLETLLSDAWRQLFCAFGPTQPNLEGVPDFRGTLAVWPEMDTEGRERSLNRRPRGDLGLADVQSSRSKIAPQQSGHDVVSSSRSIGEPHRSHQLVLPGSQVEPHSKQTNRSP